MTAELRRQLLAAIDDFWMRPADLRMLGIMRRCFGLLLLVWIGWMWVDRQLFFGEGSWLPPTASRAVVDPDTWDLYSLLPATTTTASAALGLLAVCAVALIFGIIPRIAAAASFLLLVAIQHANILLIDSEDTVIRLFAFFLIFAPSPAQLRAASLVDNPAGSPRTVFPAWPLRLFQVQMCVIYACTAIQKSDGAEWLDGNALYYVFRLDDAAKFPMPAWMTESLGMLKLCTWSVLAFEFLAPVLLWFKSTRRATIIVAVMFHLLTHYSMNLHLFHWAMLIGLLSFVNYAEWEKLTVSRPRVPPATT